ncbi:MAG: ferrous iron transport protein B [Saprospiraceae bacterium]
MGNKILLLGNPNVGKSSLFNLLTGTRQKTGNYDGVTVEKKEGRFESHRIIDLPGLSSVWSEGLDERVSIQRLLNFDERVDRIIFVADGTNLQHTLVLFSQLADLQLPMVMAINFKDELLSKGISIDIQQLQNKIACPVVLLNGRTGEGLETLKGIIQNKEFATPNAFIRTKYEAVQGDVFVNEYAGNIQKYYDSDVALADPIVLEDIETRDRQLKNFLTTIVSKSNNEPANLLTDRLDKILLHPIYGSLIFLAILFLIFQALFNLSAYPMDLIDALFGNLSAWVSGALGEGWLSSLLSDGVIAGIGGIVIFIPQIAILFILMGALESTGYMARIAYLSDRWLKGFGLSGSSVIPLMSGIACAIPAVMAAKRIRNEKERFVAMLVVPFMTCNARLPVYTILIAMIFPEDHFFYIFNFKGLALLAMYLIGTFTALFAAWVMTKLNQSESSNLWIMELPRYRWPHWKNVFLDTLNKTKIFVFSAGKIILILSVVLWGLASFSPRSEDFIEKQIASQPELTDASSVRLEYSYAGYLGKFIEPAIAPLGYDWKIGIALLSSFAAREVFVGTIAIIYSLGEEAEEQTIIEKLRSEWNTETKQPRYNLATCVSLLLFYAFAMQCISTLAIVRREMGGWKWPMIQFVGMTALAYISALVAYQLLS